MRKTLAEVAKDTSPSAHAPRVLRQSTIDAMRQCFALIAERERDLADRAGRTRKEYPRYADETGASGETSTVVPFADMKKKPDALK